MKLLNDIWTIKSWAWFGVSFLLSTFPAVLSAAAALDIASAASRTMG